MLTHLLTNVLSARGASKTSLVNKGISLKNITVVPVLLGILYQQGGAVEYLLPGIII